MWDNRRKAMSQACWSGGRRDGVFERHYRGAALIDEERKVSVDYRDLEGKRSIVVPLGRRQDQLSSDLACDGAK